MSDRELEISTGPLDEVGEKLLDAIDLASDQNGRMWITADGRRIARIVTVDDGETLDKLDDLAGLRTIRDGQIVSWGPVSDAPWKPGEGPITEWLARNIRVKDQP